VNLVRVDHKKNLGEDGRIILKCVFRKKVGGFILDLSGSGRFSGGDKRSLLYGVITRRSQMLHELDSSGSRYDSAVLWTLLRTFGLQEDFNQSTEHLKIAITELLRL
jgi:hypothetical protein